MTKEQYLEAISFGDVNSILYEYYKEKFDPKKYKTLLPFMEFLQLMDFTGYIHLGVEKSIKYYEEKYNIVRIFNKQDGQLLKIA